MWHGKGSKNSAVPHSASLLTLLGGCLPAGWGCRAGFGHTFPLPEHHDREGRGPARSPGHGRELCSLLDPFILFSTQGCATDAWPKTSQLLLAFAAVAVRARWHQQPVLAGSPTLSHSERGGASH